MIVRCISLLPSKQQAKQLGKYYYPDQQTFGLTIGKEYVVYCLEIHGGMAWVDLVSETNYLFPAPLCLFEVVDGRVSKYWELRLGEDDSVLFRPPSFFKEYFHDDLAEGVPEVVEEFQKIRTLIETEARSK